LPVRRIGKRVARLVSSIVFPSSRQYWEARYAGEGTSGKGSYGKLAAFKAEVLNGLVAAEGVRRVVEFGCGDGAQLSLAEYPEYVGLDVSPTAVALCARRFAGDPTRSFFAYDPEHFVDTLGLFRADLSLSLDVVYHLVEDAAFERYMRHLFASGERFVVVYSSNTERPALARHVRHRRFTDWVDAHAAGWTLREHIPNRYPLSGRDGSFADFYVYERTPAA
jgi:SAM-dependent methyltransferase